ncbi:hypothetical protein KEM56_005642 [Ascosphaera pollenicola]|nr:hypothetical protein KEM56_005642 [Ascosphaera pollenicola]
MNNEEFRRLLFEKSSTDSTESKPSVRHDRSRSAAAPAVGSRNRSGLPMAPRATQVDFANYSARTRQQPSAKKIKISHSPQNDGKAVQEKFQQDSTRDDQGPTLEERVKALEEARKLGQIDEDVFHTLLSKLGVGGDTSSTHLIKGLDWELLRRVKAGEDVTAKPKRSPPPALKKEQPPDEEEDFDKVMEEKEKQEIVPVSREQRVKKGVLASPPPPTSAKLTRDEILRQYKANRAAAPAQSPPPPPESNLGSKFKKIGGKDEKKRWIEQDETGRRREVLLVTGPDGKTKRKVRWIDKKPEQGKTGTGLLEVDKNAKPLGMEVPAEALARAAAAKAQEDEDEDIFADAGRDYDPLADIEKDDTSDDEAGGTTEAKTEEPKAAAEPTKPRNYFAESSTQQPEQEDRLNPLLKDPTFLAAVKKAAALRHAEGKQGIDANEGDDADAIAHRKKFLEEARRREQLDYIDIDMGFGDSRFDDDDDELPVEDEKSGNKRKRGPKKKKQDKNSADDVLKVLEGRRAADKGKR